MPLLDLKTNLKSLKYGQDLPGGGDSGQPYIKTDINTVDSGLNRLRFTKFDDGLIRGGAIGTANAAIVDTLRIGKFFADAPQGYLFITKQIGLQKSNPRLEIPKNPTNILEGGIDNFLTVSTNGLKSPTRTYSGGGVNTLAQVPINAIGGHILRHGLIPFINNDDAKYEAIVTANNNLGIVNEPSQNNRLVTLTKKFGLGDRQKNNSQVQNILNTVNTVLGIASTVSSFLGGPQIPSSISTSPEQQTIDEYPGGPGSVYGEISNTVIKRSSYTEDGFRIKNSYDLSETNNKLAIDDLNKNLSRDTILNGPSSYPDIPSPQLPVNVYGNVKTYRDILKINDRSSTLSTIGVAAEFANLFALSQGLNPRSSTSLSANPLKIIQSNPNGKPSVISGSIAYSTTPIKDEKIIYQNTYNEIVTIKGFKNWSEVSREKRVGSGRRDEINLTPIFSEKSYFSKDTSPSGKTNNIRDLVKFRIQAVNTDKPEEGEWMVFRAYLTQLSDSVDATWNPINYIGRGDKFYIYNGFTRKVQIGFKVAALSAGEMKPMYQKLNFLMSNLMPDYSGVFMRGPLVRMTIGNYIDAQLGILESLTYTISNDSPWEIALDEPEGGTKQLILPHVVEVSLNFTPIGSESNGKNDLPSKSQKISHIAQNNSNDFQYIS